MEITKWEYMDLQSYKSNHYYYDAGSIMFGRGSGYKDSNGKKMPCDTEILNDLGKKGWEVVGCTVNGSNGCVSSNVLLKRPCGRLQVIEKVNGVPIND